MKKNVFLILGVVVFVGVLVLISTDVGIITCSDHIIKFNYGMISLYRMEIYRFILGVTASTLVKV